MVLPWTEQPLRLHEHRSDHEPSLRRTHEREPSADVRPHVPESRESDHCRGGPRCDRGPRVAARVRLATDDHQAVTIAAKSGRIVARAPAGSYPDGLAYDPVERHVFVSDEAGGVETVLNARGARIATISLGGGAGNVQYDTGSRHVLVDVQTRDEVAVIDPRTNRLIRRIPVQCQSDHSLYVDASRRLAFVACDGDAKLLTLDLRSMKVTQTADVGSDPDVLAFYICNRRLYVAAESGDVAVFAEHARALTSSHSGTSPRPLTPWPSTRGATWSTYRSQQAATVGRSC